jgi:hypothetical protein
MENMVDHAIVTMNENCFICGEANLCCIPRFDERGVLRQYCCQHVPKNPELIGSPLGSGKQCPVDNPECCFSKPKTQLPNPEGDA